MKRAFLTAFLVVVALAAAAGGWGFGTLTAFRDTPHGAPRETVVTIPPGASARSVVRTLATAGLLGDERVAWWYVRYFERDPRPFKTGEYAFEGPLRPGEVLGRVRRGEVKVYRFTLPEGLRDAEIASIVGRSGLASEQEVLALARDPSVASALGLPYPRLEGFLYPDTYTFPRGVTARAIVNAMVARFRDAYAAADEGRRPGIALGLGETATLASIVEKETGRGEERARIACVFHNRLRLGMPLQTDPTVMYATMLRTGRWSRNITRADLRAPHPYNTYTTAGLPPGPIASAGAAALAAVLAPAECKDLFFVSRNDGSHVFCPNLACHAAAVRTWQVEYFRRGRAPSGNR